MASDDNNKLTTMEDVAKFTEQYGAPGSGGVNIVGTKTVTKKNQKGEKITREVADYANVIDNVPYGTFNYGELTQNDDVGSKVYQNPETGQWFRNEYDAIPDSTYENPFTIGKDGYVDFHVTDEVYNSDSFKRTFVEDSTFNKLKDIIIANGEDYKLPDPQDETKSITAGEYMNRYKEGLSEMLKSAKELDKWRTAMRQDSRYSDAVNNLSLDQMSVAATGNDKNSSVVYVPKSWVEGNSTSQLAKAIRESGELDKDNYFISKDKFKELYNLDNDVDRYDILNAMGQAKLKLRTDWVKEKETDAPDKEYLDDYARTLAFLNYLQENDPEGSWWRKAGVDAEALGEGIAEGATKAMVSIDAFFDTFGTFGQVVETGIEVIGTGGLGTPLLMSRAAAAARGQTSQQLLDDLESAQDFYTEGLHTVNDTAVGFNIVGELIGQIAVDAAFSGALKGTAKLATGAGKKAVTSLATAASSMTPYERAIETAGAGIGSTTSGIAKAIGITAVEEATPKIYNLTTTEVGAVSKAMDFVLKALPAEQQAKLVNGAVKALNILNGPEVGVISPIIRTTADFLSDTVIDAVISDPENVRKVVTNEYTGKETREYVMSQIAQNAAGMMVFGLGAKTLKGAGKLFNKTKLGRLANTKMSQIISGISAKAGDKMDNLKKWFNKGEDEWDKLTREASEAMAKGKTNKASALNDKAYILDQRRNIRAKQKEFSEMSISEEGLEEVEKTQNAIRAMNNAVDTYQRSIAYKLGEYLNPNIHPTIAGADQAITSARDAVIKAERAVGSGATIPTSDQYGWTSTILSQESSNYIGETITIERAKSVIERAKSPTATTFEIEQAAKAQAELPVHQEALAALQKKLSPELQGALDVLTANYKTFYSEFDGYLYNYDADGISLMNASQRAAYEANPDDYIRLQYAQEASEWRMQRTDGKTMNKTVSDIEHVNFGKRGDFVDPEITRYEYMMEKAQVERAANFASVNFSTPGATRNTVVSGEQTERLYILKQGRKNASSAALQYSTDFGKNSGLKISFTGEAKKVVKTATPTASQINTARNDVISSLTGPDFENVLVSQGVPEGSFLKQLDNQTYGNLTDGEKQRAYELWRSQFDDQTNAWIDQTIAEYSAPGVPTPVAQAEADIETGLLPKSAGEVVDITPNQYDVQTPYLAWAETADGRKKTINGQIGRYKGEGEWDGAKVFLGDDGVGVPSGYKIMANPSAAPSQEYVAIINDKGEKALIELPHPSEYDYERVGMATGTSRESLSAADVVLLESSDIDYVYDSVADADRLKKAKKEQDAIQKAEDTLYGRISYDDFVKDQRESMWKSFKNSRRGTETTYVRDEYDQIARRETVSHNGALYRELYSVGGRPTKAQFNKAFDDVLENGENSRYYWMFKEFDAEPDMDALGKNLMSPTSVDFPDYNTGNADIDDILLVKESTDSGKAYLPEPIEPEARPMGFVSFQQARANLGDDFEDALNRTYLMHNKEFRESELMNGLVENQLAGQRAAEKYLITDDAANKLDNAAKGKIDADATAKGFVQDFNNQIDATANNAMVETDFEKGIQALAKADPSSSIDDIREYVMLSEMRSLKNRKAAKASIGKEIDAELKDKGIEIDEAAKIKKIAGDTYDSVLEEKYNAVRNRLADNGSTIIDRDEWYDEVRKLDEEIMRTDKLAKTPDSDIILMMDEKGRTAYVQVDPAMAHLYKYRPGLNEQDMSVLARFNFTLSKLYRLNTTTINVKSAINQGFRDPMNALTGAGAWSTIQSCSKYFADTFGDDVANALGDFEEREVRILAERQGIDLAEAAAKREVAIGAALSPASTETALYSEAVKGVRNAKQGIKVSNDILDRAQTKTNNIIDKIDWFMNGKREEYLRKRVYANSLNEAMDRGLSIKQARQYAQFAMNNATTNFSRSLYHLNNYASSIPYFKAAINGTKSFWRMWSLDPLAITSRIMGGVVLPVWYLVGQSLGDPENRKVYENLPEYKKADRIPFVVGGEYFDIPIPQELSALVTPARHFVEYLYGAQNEQFNELMLNDVLGFSPLDMQGFALLDQNTMLNNPTLLDRLDQGFSQLFSQVAPIPVKSIYMAVMGKDPYTGQVLRDKTKTYQDPETGEWIVQTNTQSEFTNFIGEQFPGINSGILNSVLSGVFGQTGMDVLDSVVAAFTGKSQMAGLDTLATKQAQRAGKAITSEVYDKVDSDWYDAVKIMQDKKAALMSNPAVVEINNKLANETNESKRKMLLAQRANYADPYTEEVAQMVNNLEEKYGGSFDKYRFSAVVQLLNFGTDANWYQGNAYAKNEGQSTSLTGWKTAVNTAYNAGVPTPSDYSIFGYIKQNYETGEQEIKYTTPIGILDARNSVWTQNSVNLSNIKSALESNTFTGDQTIGQKMQTEYWNKYNKLKSNDYDGKDKLSKEWNNKVWNAIAPALANMTVDDATNNADLINYLEKYLRVPSEYQKVKGRYVSSGYDAKTGTTQVDKNAAFIKSYVREMMKAMKGEK